MHRRPSRGSESGVCSRRVGGNQSTNKQQKVKPVQCHSEPNMPEFLRTLEDNEKKKRQAMTWNIIKPRWMYIEMLAWTKREAMTKTERMETSRQQIRNVLQYLVNICLWETRLLLLLSPSRKTPEPQFLCWQPNQKLKQCYLRKKKVWLGANISCFDCFFFLLYKKNKNLISSITQGVFFKNWSSAMEHTHKKNTRHRKIKNNKTHEEELRI